jgi:hypothetical protein
MNERMERLVLLFAAVYLFTYVLLMVVVIALVRVFNA